ncbi:unnamed protein product [Didymodactylos carnosus]|uniref:Nuclear receptor n=1 Tax=Didymodactylos carnosus TaxID=1234261 RepID=A0A8S2LWX3_9BILA|nr:unnamed protein product [Didymodactylos carnosus]
MEILHGAADLSPEYIQKYLKISSMYADTSNTMDAKCMYGSDAQEYHVDLIKREGTDCYKRPDTSQLYYDNHFQQLNQVNAPTLDHNCHTATVVKAQCDDSYARFELNKSFPSSLYDEKLSCYLSNKSFTESKFNLTAEQKQISREKSSRARKNQTGNTSNKDQIVHETPDIEELKQHEEALVRQLELLASQMGANDDKKNNDCQYLQGHSTSACHRQHRIEGSTALYRFLLRSSKLESIVQRDRTLSCGVCKDYATGVHYGLLTCEGCRGFFKRTILNGRKFRCRSHGNCVINKLQRNHCKYCRFQKCLISGMMIGAVRLDRVPSRRIPNIVPYFCQYKNGQAYPQTISPQHIDSSMVVGDDIMTTSDLKSTMEEKLNSSFSFPSTYKWETYRFDQLSTKDIMCDLLKQLLDVNNNLPFYKQLSDNLNNLILRDKWADILVFFVIYFLSITISVPSLLLFYNEHPKRLSKYLNIEKKANTDIYGMEENQYTRCIIEKFVEIVHLAINCKLTDVEVESISILLVAKYDEVMLNNIDRNELASLENSYLDILQAYEANTFSEQPVRMTQMLLLFSQIRQVSQLLVTNKMFFLPFLLIPTSI